jgi:hypothetical protein
MRGTVLVEIWMLTTGSMAAMVATLSLIVVLSARLCRSILRLMGPEDHPDAPRKPRAVTQPAAPVAAAVRHPATRGRAARPAL